MELYVYIILTVGIYLWIRFLKIFCNKAFYRGMLFLFKPYFISRKFCELNILKFHWIILGYF